MCYLVDLHHRGSNVELNSEKNNYLESPKLHEKSFRSISITKEYTLVLHFLRESVWIWDDVHSSHHVSLSLSIYVICIFFLLALITRNMSGK